jgi:hypothetical protein
MDKTTILKNHFRTHWPVYLALALLFYVSWGFLMSGWYSSRTADWDWDQYWGVREVVRRIWMAGGSFFPWVAHFCGGFPILDSTEIPFHSPFVILWQLLGPVWGSKWEYIILLSIGMIGMYKAAGEIAPNSPRYIRAAAALHFVICGFFLFHLNAGHFSFAEFSFFSWIVYGFMSGKVAPIALSLAAGVHFGCNNYFMHAIIFCVIAGLTSVKWFKHMVISGVWAFLLSAPLLIHNFLEYPKAKYLKWTAANHHEHAQNIDHLIRYMTDPSTNLWNCEFYDCYWEFGNYIGIVALLLCVFGIFHGLFISKLPEAKRFMRPWSIVGFFFLLVALGPFAEYAPFRLFWNLPLLSRLEVNTRFQLSLTVVMFLGWIWYLGVTLQKSETKKKIAMALAVISLFPALSYAKKMFDQPGQGNLLPDLRGKPADMKEMRTVGDFRVGRYNALATETGINHCHISSSKGTYPGKVQLGKGPLLISPAGSTANWDDRYWMIKWEPQGNPDSGWILNQNYNENFVVDSLSDPNLKLNTFETPDHLIGFKVEDQTKVKPQSYLFRLRLQTPAAVMFSYGVCLIAWMIFLSRLIIGRVRETEMQTKR